ncbi:hypothetical protein BLNAU_798 [Blattamonas nauphoetae]|uniref:COMM domain-containing protein n=1 Tax=Blattamonas nauphoetae TaxID=2049346 RepID=A0ABQ9YKI8_9EUKA|nr:hypothetical protein BLNAU_798 [Blattamonas nauphoetae]
MSQTSQPLSLPNLEDYTWEIGATLANSLSTKQMEPYVKNTFVLKDVNDNENVITFEQSVPEFQRLVKTFADMRATLSGYSE